MCNKVFITKVRSFFENAFYIYIYIYIYIYRERERERERERARERERESTTALRSDDWLFPVGI